MRKKKRIFGIFSCIVILAFLFGCTTTSSNMADSATLSAEGAGGVYYPKLPDRIQSPDAAKADLTALLNQGRKFAISLGNDKYYSEKDVALYANRGYLTELTKGASGLTARCYGRDQRLSYMVFKSVDVHDDRIEVSPRMPLFYADLLEFPIAVTKSSGTYKYKYAVHLRNRISFLFDNRAAAQRFADDLFIIQQPLKREYEDRLALFESKVAEYRALSVKPTVSEEQRKYIVQANALSKQKKYYRAIDMYDKVIEIDPVAYPAAYFNMALLSAQMRRYNLAISYMKQYLMLLPEAKDARSSQDKIYEWELMLQENQQ